MSIAARKHPGVLGDLWSVLRDNPDYRRLYLARAASLLGDWFNLLAVLALLRQLGAGGAGAVGTVVVLKLLPVTLAGPAAGVVADRFSRKAILLLADASRFFLVLGPHNSRALRPKRLICALAGPFGPSRPYSALSTLRSTFQVHLGCSGLRAGDPAAPMAFRLEGS